MLTKLLPDQISKFWDIIKYAIEESLPPTVGESPNKMNKILSSCLSGKIDVWASYNRKEDSAKFEGLVLTRILFDEASETKNLLIYCLYGYEMVDKKSWIDGYKTILKYANSRKCSQIVGYTNVPLIIEVVKKLGGESNYTFISFNVKEGINSIGD
jgi:hypothetical protein